MSKLTINNIQAGKPLSKVTTWHNTNMFKSMSCPRMALAYMYIYIYGTHEQTTPLTYMTNINRMNCRTLNMPKLTINNIQAGKSFTNPYPKWPLDITPTINIMSTANCSSLQISNTWANDPFDIPIWLHNIHRKIHRTLKMSKVTNIQAGKSLDQSLLKVTTCHNINSQYSVHRWL